MKEAFSGLGLRTAGAGSACGQLSRYIYSADAYENVASQRQVLELLLANFDFVRGLIGGRCTREGADQSGAGCGLL